MYRLYVDEVGTDGLTHLDKDHQRFLSLTGVAMTIAHARDHLTGAMNLLKAEVFRQDPDSPIILHRKEIMGFKGPYQCLREKEKSDLFNRHILNILQGTEYRVITALIDKEWMLKQKHWQKTHPYHYLMEILVEKYVQFLERKRSTGDIMPESRPDKDRFLQGAFSEVRARGTDFVPQKRICAVLRADNLKFRTKKDNIAGLQLCDLIAHPSHIYTRSLMKHQVRLGPFARQVIDILKGAKYDRAAFSGKIIGYGIKHLPQ